jgi:hypothetical protein
MRNNSEYEASSGKDDGKEAEGRASHSQISRASAATGSVFWAAIAVGGALILLGLSSVVLQLVDFTTFLLILCSGLGLLFGAFGSMATIRYKGIVVAGVAAVALVLLLTVDRLTRDDYVIITISGDVLNANKVDMYSDQSYFGAPRRNSYQFMVRRQDLSSRNVSVLIELVGTELISGEQELAEYIFECVEREFLLSRLGSTEGVEWRFDAINGELRSWDGSVIATVGPCRSGPSMDAPGARFSGLTKLLVGTAFAFDINELVSALQSDSSLVRREARSDLAEVGPSIVEQLGDRLLSMDISYRERLGIIVAFTEMLREHKQERLEIASTIDDEVLRALIRAAGDPDRTIRIYASEFLYDLGDSRSVDMAFEEFSSVDANGKYNLLLVVQGAYPHMDEAAKTKIDTDLRDIYNTVGPRTQALIGDIVETTTWIEQ